MSAEAPNTPVQELPYAQRAEELNVQLYEQIPTSMDAAKHLLSTAQQMAGRLETSANGQVTLHGEEIDAGVADDLRTAASKGLEFYRLDSDARISARTATEAEKPDELTDLQRAELKHTQEHLNLSDEDAFKAYKQKNESRLKLDDEIAAASDEDVAPSRSEDVELLNEYEELDSVKSLSRYEEKLKAGHVPTLAELNEAGKMLDVLAQSTLIDIAAFQRLKPRWLERMSAYTDANRWGPRPKGEDGKEKADPIMDALDVAVQKKIFNRALDPEVPTHLMGDPMQAAGIAYFLYREARISLKKDLKDAGLIVEQPVTPDEGEVPAVNLDALKGWGGPRDFTKDARDSRGLGRLFGKGGKAAPKAPANSAVESTTPAAGEASVEAKAAATRRERAGKFLGKVVTRARNSKVVETVRTRGPEAYDKYASKEALSEAREKLRNIGSTALQRANVALLDALVRVEQAPEGRKDRKEAKAEAERQAAEAAKRQIRRARMNTMRDIAARGRANRRLGYTQSKRPTRSR